MGSQISKPTGLTPEYASQFKDAAIVRAYKYREPYSEETFQVLQRLAGCELPIVADIGCGPGDLTFGLSKFSKRIDAVDMSEQMLQEAMHLSKGQNNIRWIQACAEDAELKGPYDLITAADSVHWMDWTILFAKLRAQLKTGKFFCVVGRGYAQKYWWDEDFQKIINTYTTNKDYQKYDIIEELKKSGLVNVVGDQKTNPTSFKQSVEDLIEAFHSRNGFSRERMGESAAKFDFDAKKHLERHAKNGMLSLSSFSRVTWMTIN